MYIRFVENVLKNLRFVNVNNMKQTPIPEKIESKYKADYGFLVDYINSLIDVLTEQQKEIEELRNDGKVERETQCLHWNTIRNLQQRLGEIDSMKKVDPYTAMRSTGDCARCGHNHYTDDYVFCNCCNTNAPQPQPIKPQEDIRVEIIKEIIKWDRTTTQKQAHNLALKILAIVKGE